MEMIERRAMYKTGGQPPQPSLYPFRVSGDIGTNMMTDDGQAPTNNYVTLTADSTLGGYLFKPARYASSAGQYYYKDGLLYTLPSSVQTLIKSGAFITEMDYYIKKRFEYSSGKYFERPAITAVGQTSNFLLALGYIDTGNVTGYDVTTLNTWHHIKAIFTPTGGDGYGTRRAIYDNGAKEVTVKFAQASLFWRTDEWWNEADRYLFLASPQDGRSNYHIEGIIKNFVIRENDE